MRRLAVPLVLAAGLVGGCGGAATSAPRPSADGAAPARSPATRSGSPTDAQIRAALQLPARVPLRATGAAPAGQVRVVRAWLVELSSGEVARAARRFAVPSRFQNFTSVALIRSRRQALAVSDSLPCGARMTTAGGASGFVVYEARLTERPGGACGAGVGGVVRGAVRVRGGRMQEWYRLPDRSSPRRGEAVIPQGPVI